MSIMAQSKGWAIMSLIIGVFTIFGPSSIGLAFINSVLGVIYLAISIMLFWFCKNEEMLKETAGFGYLARFFISASANRFAAVFSFYGGIWFLAPIFLSLSVYYSGRALIYFYKNRKGILLAVGLRRKLIDTAHNEGR